MKAKPCSSNYKNRDT